MLICEKLSVSYNFRKIFKDFSVSIFPGSVVLIKGNNGSGKTSLLRILSNIQIPTTGKISWNIDPFNINYITHISNLKPNLTVFENIEFWSSLYNSPELLIAAIHYFKLDKFVDTIVKNLSAGWKQRVMLAKLIACYSNIWILDEPENNLDKEGKELLINLINTRVNQDAIIIIASHNLIDLPNLITINMDDYKINY